MEDAVQAMRLRRLESEVKALRRTLVRGLMRGLGRDSVVSSEASGSAGGGERSWGWVMMVSVRTWMTISLRASWPLVKQWKKRSRLLRARSCVD